MEDEEGKRKGKKKKRKKIAVGKESVPGAGPTLQAVQ
jgi:hypothetical protein